jgi:TonB-dependent receptor-like protein
MSVANYLNELRFGIHRSSMPASIVDRDPGLSISLLPGQPFGMLDVAGMSLIGNNPELPLGVFSTTYQLQEQASRTTDRQTFKFGGEFRRIEASGPLDFTLSGIYTFQDLTPFGIPAQSNNPALEFFLRGLPLSYLGSNPAESDSRRDYRQNIVSVFVQEYFRVTHRLVLNAGLRYDFYSNPSETHGAALCHSQSRKGLGSNRWQSVCGHTPQFAIATIGFRLEYFR